MKLKDAAKLQAGDLIACGACFCDGSVETVRVGSPYSRVACDCRRISHTNSGYTLVYVHCKIHRKKYEQPPAEWGMGITPGEAKKITLLKPIEMRGGIEEVKS